MHIAAYLKCANVLLFLCLLRRAQAAVFLPFCGIMKISSVLQNCQVNIKRPEHWQTSELLHKNFADAIKTFAGMQKRLYHYKVASHINMFKDFTKTLAAVYMCAA